MNIANDITQKNLRALPNKLSANMFIMDDKPKAAAKKKPN
mgnify:CR=1 FL=1